MKATIRNNTNQVIGEVRLRPWRFKSGSVGFWGTVKATDGQKRYQINAYVVEIGSRTASVPTAETAADPDEQQSPVEEECDQQAAVE